MAGSLEYLRPMLDASSPRVFNVNALTRRILAQNPAAKTFFRNKQLNNIVLIKDTPPPGRVRHEGRSIGTKLYFPFNEGDIYEGGRTIFVQDQNLRQALVQSFGAGALVKEALDVDLRILQILDRLPSLDPFLLKDVFLNEGLEIDESYFEVSKEVWSAIENFIVLRFETLVQAAFPDAMQSDDKARKLVQKIWEGRDLEALRPLVMAFRLPENEALEIFSAWKGINFYSYQTDRAKPMFFAMMGWLKELQIPVGVVSSAERTELKATLAMAQQLIRAEWQKVDGILRDYQVSYDRMFKEKVSSVEFVTFLRNSRKMYWDLGNSLGKCNHAAYCWDMSARRFPGRKMAWEQTREVVVLLDKIFKEGRTPQTAMAW